MRRLRKRNYRVEALLANAIADAESELRTHKQKRRRNHRRRRVQQVQQNVESQAQSFSMCSADSNDNQPAQSVAQTTQDVRITDSVQQKEAKVKKTPRN
jgi:hypothetical protein